MSDTQASKKTSAATETAYAFYQSVGRLVARARKWVRGHCPPNASPNGVPSAKAQQLRNFLAILQIAGPQEIISPAGHSECIQDRRHDKYHGPSWVLSIGSPGIYFNRDPVQVQSSSEQSPCPVARQTS